jgi:hypothetical protein
LGVEEWRISVGRAETNRKGEGEEGGVADDDFGNNARKRESGEEGRERRDQDRHNTQKLGGRGMPIDAGTGEVRGSDERGDRTAVRGTCVLVCACECKQERHEVKYDRLGC